MNLDSLKAIKSALVEFRDQRNWEKFHSPKNLAMALSVESSELVEIFQWLTEKESRRLDDESREAAAYELADIFMYTLLLSEQLEIDLGQYTKKKIDINQDRFPKPE